MQAVAGPAVAARHDGPDHADSATGRASLATSRMLW